MSKNENFLKTTTDLIETNPEIKSFIYQQILDFNPFITDNTTVFVIARDSSRKNMESTDESFFAEDVVDDENPSQLHRIAIILKDEDSSIEAEAFHENIYEAIKLAKEKLIAELIEIQNEVESPNDRLQAIQQASSNSQIH